MRISACYIVRNEAAKLERSLASLEGAVDEIIVVDTGSSDDTVKIAEAHGAQVFHFPWQDDFSAARNVSLSKATGDWILVVDADEYFSEGMAKNIRPAVERYGADADLLIFMRREFDEDKGEVLLDTYVSRLLRRTDGLAYEGAIHEEPRCHGSIIARMATIPDRELMMMHTGYSAVLLRSKGERNLALLLRELESGHPRDSIYMYLAETYDGLKDEAQALRFAWMDVMRGRKPIIFASRTYCILIRILANHPERYQERRKATAMAVKDFPEIPEFHAEYAECLALGFAYRAAVRESKTALDLFASGVGCGMEPSMFTQETADFVRERMEMWERLALEGMDAFGDLAGRGDWKGALAEAENAAEQKGTMLFSLLLLMEDDDSEKAREAMRFSESLLPPEMDAMWRAYRGEKPVEARIEENFARLLPVILGFVGKKGAKRLENLFAKFSEKGRVAAARALTEAEAWDSVSALLLDLQDGVDEEVFRLLGVASYRLGDRAGAKRYFLRAREIMPSAETDSYLRWLGEAAEDA